MEGTTRVRALLPYCLPKRSPDVCGSSFFVPFFTVHTLNLRSFTKLREDVKIVAVASFGTGHITSPTRR